MARSRRPASAPAGLAAPAAAPATAPAAPVAPLTAGRKRLFWGVTLLLPVVFFALLEGGLRLGSYGGDYPLFVPLDRGADSAADSVGGILYPNHDVATRYFAGGFVPNPNADFFAAEKPARGLRVVVQGESSAAGYPFYRGASFPQVLRRLLRTAYPDRTVEVVNTAMAAVNSYTLLDFADEVVAVRPDAVLIYTGHNEFYGALGAASSERFGSPGLVRLYLRLRRFRTVQLLRTTVARVQRAAAPASPAAGTGRPSSTLMAAMVGQQSVPLGSETYQLALRQFEENLDALLARYQAEGIPVYIGTLASNEADQRPFVVAHVDGQGDHGAAIAAAAGQVRAGQTATAVAALCALAGQDSLAADVPFALGRILLATGDTTAAAAALRRARDLDALRFRAPAAFNGVIRRVAAARGAHVVESEAAFRSASPGGVVGRSLMLEHLHPTLDGYALLADTFLDALIAEGAFGPQQRAVPPGRSLTLITPPDSLAGLLRISLLTQSWPFRADEEQRVDTAGVAPFVLAQARAALRGDDWLGSVSALAAWYGEQGDAAHARQAYLAAAMAYPFLPAAHVAWANFEMAQVTSGADPSRLDDAANLYDVALALDPANAEASMMLGALRLQAGDAAGAVPLLERAAGGASPPEQALYNLAGAYATLGRWDDAGRVAARLTQANPRNAQFQQFATAIQRRTLRVGA